MKTIKETERQPVEFVFYCFSQCKSLEGSKLNVKMHFYSVANPTSNRPHFYFTQF